MHRRTHSYVHSTYKIGMAESRTMYSRQGSAKSTCCTTRSRCKAHAPYTSGREDFPDPAKCHATRSLRPSSSICCLHIVQFPLSTFTVHSNVGRFRLISSRKQNVAAPRMQLFRCWEPPSIFSELNGLGISSYR